MRGVPAGAADVNAPQDRKVAAELGGARQRPPQTSAPQRAPRPKGRQLLQAQAAPQPRRPAARCCACVPKGLA